MTNTVEKSAKMFSKLPKLLLLSAFFFLLLAQPTESVKKKKKLCKLDYLLQCFNEPISFFTSQANGTGLAANEQEFEQYCFSNHDYLPLCFKTWLARCGSPWHKALMVKAYLNTYQQAIDQFCDPKHSMRWEFVKNAQCIIQQVKLSETYRAKCIRDVQANFEFVHQQARQTGNLQNFVRGNCCAYNQWEECITSLITTKCSNAASHVFLKLIHLTSSNLIPGVCSPKVFNAGDTKQCPPEVYQAARTFTPKGLKSNSYVSATFSQLCPNVGFGIEEGRDNVLR